MVLPLLRPAPRSCRRRSAAALARAGAARARAMLYRLVGDRYWTAAAERDARQSDHRRARASPGGAAAGPGGLAAARRGLRRHRPLRAGAARYERANRLTAGGDPAALAGMGEAMLLRATAAQRHRRRSCIDRALQLDPASPRRCSTARSLPIAKAVWRWRANALRPCWRCRRRKTCARRCRRRSTRSMPSSIRSARCRHRHSSARHARAGAGRQGAGQRFAVRVRALAGRRAAAGRQAQRGEPAAGCGSVGRRLDDRRSRACSPGQSVSVVARISASGSPLPRSGDLYGQIDYVAGKSGARALEIDRLSP